MLTICFAVNLRSYFFNNHNMTRLRSFLAVRRIGMKPK